MTPKPITEIIPVGRYLVVCKSWGCSWQEEHESWQHAVDDGLRHEQEWHA